MKSKALTFLVVLILLVLGVVLIGGCSGREPLMGENWQGEWVDQSRVASTYFRYCSIAVDGEGRPHIAYGRNYLYYAAREDDGWKVQIVDTEENAGVDAIVMVDKSGCLHIGYMGTISMEKFLSDLRHAYFDGHEWIVETVPSPEKIDWSAVTLDASNRPVFVYLDSSEWFSSQQHVLRYLEWNGSAWESEPIVEDFAINSSVALDQEGQPWVSYLSGAFTTEVFMAHKDDQRWGIAKIMEIPGEPLVGTSIAVDAAGHPHLTFYDSGHGALMYVCWDGEHWQIQEVDNDGDVGAGASLALDTLGHPHIAYADTTNGTLKYAHWNESEWQIEVVETRHVSALSLALDAEGGAHIAYMVAVGHQIRYAYHAPTSP
ncbi:MAG: hypothetical protein K8R89_00175 [Anaerolineae bacterium]|nr:hypothetical protein [Anaerolineae bacterium]